MGRLRTINKELSPTGEPVLTFKQSIHQELYKKHLSLHKKYRKIAIASIILNISLILSLFLTTKL